MKGYFFIADLLGYANMVKNSNDNELDTRIISWVDLVTRSASSIGINNIQLISDTVFAAADDSTEDLRKLIEFSKCLLNEGVQKSLCIRGAITYGDYTWGEHIVYGKAVIGAHELESSQNWIGVSCEPQLPHASEHWRYGRLIAYPTPMKSGSIIIRPVVDWDIPTTACLYGLVCSEGLTRSGEHLSWPLAEKVNNTLEFSLYKSLLQKNGGDPEIFIGLSPISLIESHI